MKTPPRTVAALVLLATLTGASTAGAAELRGSMRSMTKQHGVAVEHGYTFLRTQAQLERLAGDGRLERVTGNDDFVVHEQVTHPYARPEVGLLLERLGAQYRAATGERLVVTSLVRPIAEQPANAHRLSVHPAGMAVDLRVPANPESRAWLERALLGMERSGVLDVTREYRPPHYHVAVFPEKYLAYAERRMAAEEEAAAAQRRAEAEAEAARETAVEAAAAPQLAPVEVSAGAAAPGRSSALPGALVLALGGTGLAALPLARRRRAAGR